MLFNKFKTFSYQKLNKSFLLHYIMPLDRCFENTVVLQYKLLYIIVLNSFLHISDLLNWQFLGMELQQWM
jgi:hypothetical protein